MSKSYLLDEGVYRPPSGVVHRDDEYDDETFAVLRRMQERHFWYRGRHRFLWYAFHTLLRRRKVRAGDLRMIDLGGGCGGWIRYLADRGLCAAELALGDSSLRALELARGILPDSVRRYQIDLLRLEWRERWDVAFLLDVLEHLPDHERALCEVCAALAPGGLLLVTTPALKAFWSYNDELVQHQRRYARRDYATLADRCGFELLDARYFQFFLSPLMLVSRWGRRAACADLSRAERRALLSRTHRVPPAPLNAALTGVFALETPLGHFVRFPWGTSILAIFHKPG